MKFATRSLALGSLFLFLGALGAAQGQVIVVDDDGGAGVDFADLGDAIDAAADGDLILVHDGVYSSPPPPPFGFGEHPVVTGKSLSIVAAAGARPVIERGLEVTGLSESQSFTLRGFDFRDGTVSPIGGFGSLHLSNSEGPIWIEDCFVSGFVTLDALVVRDVEALHLVRYSSFGDSDPAPRVDAADSTLSLYDCILVGSSTLAPCCISVGLRLQRSTAFVSGSTIIGGSSNSPSFASSAVTLDVDSTLTLLATETIPGVGGDSPPEDPIEDNGGTVIELSGNAKKYTVGSPVADGQPIDFTITADPGDLVMLAYSTGSEQRSLPGLVGTPFLEFPLTGIANLGIVPASGVISFSINALGPNTGFTEFFGQLVVFELGTGAAVLSGGSVLQILP